MCLWGHALADSMQQSCPPPQGSLYCWYILLSLESPRLHISCTPTSHLSAHLCKPLLLQPRLLAVGC